MYCKHCGHKISAGESYCNACGEKVKGREAPARAPKKRRLTVVISAIFLLAAGVLVCFIFFDLGDLFHHEVRHYTEQAALEEKSDAVEKSSEASQAVAGSGKHALEEGQADLEQESEAQTTRDAWEDEGYLFPDSSTKLLTKEEVMYLPPDQMRIARNEIYARHGYTFASEDLRNYFNAKNWYTSLHDNENITLNETEKENIALIQACEKGQ